MTNNNWEIVDSESNLGYNNNNDDLNDAHSGLDQYEQIVKLDEQKPIHDTECRHETLVPDPKDTLGDAVYHGCSNPKCGVGFYIRK